MYIDYILEKKTATKFYDTESTLAI